MTDSDEKTHLTREQTIRCLKCGQYAHADATSCPHCGNAFAPRTISADEFPVPPVRRPGSTARFPDEKLDDRVEFPATASVILQFLPTGACVSLSLKQPMVLGRGLSQDVNTMLDLTDFQGLLYGVSRQHCKLERRDDRLYLTDLGSTNGTYCNNKRLPPFQEHMIGHGDRLIVGALHIAILFTTMG